MNILLINNIFKTEGRTMVGGVEYHRMVQPHKVLRRHFPEYDFIMSSSLESAGEEVLNQTDLVIFSRMIPEGASEKLNELNKPFGLDLDDWWYLPKSHISFQDYEQFEIPKKTVASIRDAYFVICTTPILAEKIQPINENVIVIENGIDSEDEVWKPRKVSSSRLRFGFTQGNSHYEDIKSISDSVSSCYKDLDFYKNAQIVYCGFYGEDMSWRKVTMEQIFELMLTENHKALRLYKDYLVDLGTFKKNLNDSDYPYKRKWAVDVDVFGNVYNEMDIVIAPLIKNEFNSCKSELKMLEAGFKDCAIMLNHVEPYTLLATDENSFDLNKKTFREWTRIILRNPELVAEKKAQLRKDVERYDLKHLSKKRNELYKKYKK
jgi:hypothetical protein